MQRGVGKGEVAIITEEPVRGSTRKQAETSDVADANTLPRPLSLRSLSCLCLLFVRPSQIALAGLPAQYVAYERPALSKAYLFPDSTPLLLTWRLGGSGSRSSVP